MLAKIITVYHRQRTSKADDEPPQQHTNRRLQKIVTNFSSDVKDGEAYAYLLIVIAPEHSNQSTLVVIDLIKIATLVLEHADRMGWKRYLTAKDIVEGSPNLKITQLIWPFLVYSSLP